MSHVSHVIRENERDHMLEQEAQRWKRSIEDQPEDETLQYWMTHHPRQMSRGTLKVWIGCVRLDGHCHHVTMLQTTNWWNHPVHMHFGLCRDDTIEKAMHMCKDAAWNCGLNYHPEEDLLAHIKKNTVGIVLEKLPR